MVCFSEKMDNMLDKRTWTKLQSSTFFVKYIPHCSKVKMNGKKLSRCLFYFPGLLGTSLMSKQEKTFFSYTWTSEIILFVCFGRQMDRTQNFFLDVKSCIFLQLSNFAIMRYDHFPTRNGLKLYKISNLFGHF